MGKLWVKNQGFNKLGMKEMYNLAISQVQKKVHLVDFGVQMAVKMKDEVIMQLNILQAAHERISVDSCCHLDRSLKYVWDLLSWHYL